MSNFNEFFKNRGAKTIVDRFFNAVDIFSETKITSLNYNIVEEPPKPASYYVENKLTATHKVRIEYTTTASEDEVKLAEFEVPKEIDGLFIIDGAYRIVTNKLESSYDCRIIMSGTGVHCINFDYNRKFDIDKRILKIKKTDSELSLVDRDINIKFEDIDNVSDSDRELLKLTEDQIKKFQVKLDLDYVPEYITTKLINDCMNFGDDRLKDLIVDKNIESVPKSFLQYIFRSNNGRNYNTARRQISNYFMKYGIIQEQVNSISVMALRFFKGSSDISSKESNVQVPPSINAMNMESLGEKITIHKTVAYNPTFADLIDLGDTPINQNTNLQNALTVSTHITDDGVLFDVYDKNFTRITIKYLDYLNSKVCASEYVDYNTNQLKPNENGEVEVKYRMKRKMVKVDEIDLIDLHPDYRLSSATRRIPFINSTDSVRISMGASMLKNLSSNIVICYVNLVKCWKPLKINYSRFGHL